MQDLASKWPAKVLALGEVVGGLTAAAAAHLGLRPGTPVAQVGHSTGHCIALSTSFHNQHFHKKRQ